MSSYQIASDLKYLGSDIIILAKKQKELVKIIF